MTGSTVPVVRSLSDIYPPPALGTEGPRWQKLLAQFEEQYGRAATFVARSPGRVNIIGEHIDYSLYSVLPMAITADALLAVSSSPTAPDATSFTIRLANTKDEEFPARTLELPVDGQVDIDATKFEWTNYFRSGLRGALQALSHKKAEGWRPCNMDVLMDGNVPVGGGLSSSAAFVSASALAVMTANGESSIDKKALTELAIVSERAVGVNSGGYVSQFPDEDQQEPTLNVYRMDQAASVFSEQGSALFVSFTPELAARPVKFPPTRPELCFVIAQSFVTSNKQVTGPIHYNLRVVEVSLAAAYLNAVLNPPGTELPVDHGPLGVSLQGFQDAYFYHKSGSDYSAAKSLAKEEELEKLVALAKDTLDKEEGYTGEEIASVLGLTASQFEKRYLSSFPVRAERFMLRQRALHVFTEALRVLSFLTLLERPVHSGASDTTLFNQKLGDLMNETQDSCRDLYACSCAEIDQICKIARGAGAYGSRLTGAGWGGCSVHLVPADKVADVSDALEKEYYGKRELTAEQKRGAVVVSRPAGGSAVYRVE